MARTPRPPMRLRVENLESRQLFRGGEASREALAAMAASIRLGAEARRDLAAVRPAAHAAALRQGASAQPATVYRWVGPGRAWDLTTPALPGFALHVGKGDVRTASGRAYQGRLALTVLPGAGSGDYQVRIAGVRGAVHFRTPARVTLPNTLGVAPGSELTLLTMSPATGVVEAGTLRASADGRRLETVAGGLAGPGLILAPRASAPGAVARESAPIATSQADGAATQAASDPADPPPIVAEDLRLSVAVGDALRLAVAPGGLDGGADVYSIAPMPLPANMRFDTGSGVLSFAPAPGQAGTYKFTVTALRGDRPLAVRTVAVEAAQSELDSTVVSGRVVDEAGRPLAGMPVTIGDLATISDEEGRFSLAGVPEGPALLSAGGDLASSRGRLGLLKPVDRLLGHDAYAKTENVIPQPLVLPYLDYSSPEAATQAGADGALVLASTALPGLAIEVADPKSSGSSPSSTLAVALLPAAVTAQQMPEGMTGSILSIRTSGFDPDDLVNLTLPAPPGAEPGSEFELRMFNPRIGGHDVAVRVAVSEDGRTMQSLTPFALSATRSAPTREEEGDVPARLSGAGALSLSAASDTFEACVLVTPKNPPMGPTGPCGTCPTPAGGSAPPGSTGPVGSFGGSGPGPMPGPMLASDINLVTGEFYQDHRLATYQSLGQSRGIDLQYSSLQGNRKPVIQYRYTQPMGGGSLEKITFSLNVGGATSSVEFDGPLVGGQTYYIPMQFSAASMATGLYDYTIAATQDYGPTSGTGFAVASLTTQASGKVDVVDRSAEPVGSGWSVGGLQRVHEPVAGGPALITDGHLVPSRFSPVYNAGQVKVQDLALASSGSSTQVLRNADGDGRFDTFTPVASGGGVFGTASADFDGDGKPDQAILGGTALAIQLNNGLGGFTAGTSYTLPAGYYAKAVVAGNFGGVYTGHPAGTVDLAVILAPTTGTGYVVRVYTGAGNGTFPTATSNAAGNGSYSGTRLGSSFSGNRPGSAVAADFNADGKADVAFTTDDGKLDVMLASGSGAMGTATALTLNSGFSAIGVAAVDYNGDGDQDLVVESSSPATVLAAVFPYGNLSVYSNGGSGAFSYVSNYVLSGHPYDGTVGLVAGNFYGSAKGLHVAVPTNGDGPGFFKIGYLELVSLSTSGTFGFSTMYPLDNATNPTAVGNIVAADFDGSGRPGIALTDGTGYIRMLVPDLESDQFMPMRKIRVSTAVTDVGMLAVAPFAGTAAASGYRGHASEPSTLVKNVGGTWTRTYPDGTVIQYDTAGREVSETDRNLNATTYNYVPAGQPGAGSLLSAVDPVGLRTTLAYDAVTGRLKSVLDPAGRTTTITLDSSNNLTRVVDPDGATSTYSYATPSDHLMTGEVTPRGQVATVTYNAFNQATSESLPGGGATTSVTPALSEGLVTGTGNPASSLSTGFAGVVTDPNGHAMTTPFTWMSHPAGSTDALGRTTVITYNNRGFPSSVTDEMRQVTTYTYDKRGNVTSITQPLDVEDLFIGPAPPAFGLTPATMTIAYHPTLNIPTSVTDFLGRTTTYTLDARGNVLRRTDPDLLHQDWTYNAAGQVLTDTDRAGIVTRYRYDAYGRTIAALPPAGTPSASTAAAGKGPDAAFDADPATAWASTAAAAWVQIQLAGNAAQRVTTYSVTAAADAATYPGRTPKDWALKGSADGTTWTTVDTRTGQAAALNTGSGTTLSYAVTTPGSYRYYRLDVTANNGDATATQLGGVDLRAPQASTRSVSALGWASASSTPSATQGAGVAFDQTTGTTWLSGTTPWLQYQFGNGEAYAVTQYQLTSGSDTFTYQGRAPKDWQLQGSVDGVSWATLDSRTNAAVTANSTTTTYTVASPGVYRFYRLNVTANNGDPTYTQLADVQLLAVVSGATTGVAFVGTMTASSTPSPTQGAATAFDQDTNTTWLADTTPWVRLQFAGGAAYTVTEYRFTSGFDTPTYPGRAPKSWQLQGSNDGLVWSTLDTRINQADAAGLHATSYTVATPGSYKNYRLYVPTNNGDPSYTQLADLDLRVATAPASVASTAYSFAYDAAGNVAAATDPLGNTSYVRYDAMNRPASAVDPAQARLRGTAARSAFAYDPAGNLGTMTDALGRVTTYSYDARDRLVSATDPVNQGSVRHTTYVWDGMNLIATVDPLEHRTTYGYDVINRLTSVKDALSHTATYSYYSRIDDGITQYFSIVTATDPRGNKTTQTYDARGRLAQVDSPGAPGATTTASYRYDNNGNLTTLTLALAGRTTAYAYDNLDRLTTVTDPMGHVTSYGYTAAGDLAWAADPLNHRTTYGYDARRNRVSVQAPAGGGTTAYTYDLAGRLTSLVDPVGNVTAWSYDAAGRVAAEVDPLGKVTAYQYDAVGNLTNRTDRIGRITQYGYDDDDRLTAEKWLPVGGGTATNLITQTYDFAGRLTLIQDASSKYAYTYYDNNLLRTVDDAGTSGLPQVTLTYGYDDANNRTSVADTKGGLTSYAYDARDRLTTIAQSGTGVASKSVAIAYDAADRRTTLTRYSDATGSTAVFVSKYAYDADDRLTTLTHQTAAGTVRSSYVYTLDAADRLTSEARVWTTSGGTASDTVGYAYTNDDQLTTVTHSNGSFAGESFGFDSNGNRNTGSYATGTGNRTSSDGTYTYGYDLEGNLTSKTLDANNQTLYFWDQRNRLTSATIKVAGVTTTATYTYDAMDRRIVATSGGTTTATLYDGSAAILDFVNGSGTPAARYLQADAVDEILAREVAGTVGWYLQDRLGTVRDIASNAGAIVNHIDYKVYGEVLSETGAIGLRDRWKFTGRELDAATGLYYYRTRYYDPSSGSFISDDSISFMGGDANLSRYIGNNPSNYSDPFGQYPFLITGAIGAVGGGLIGGGMALWNGGDGWAIGGGAIKGGLIGGAAGLTGGLAAGGVSGTGGAFGFFGGGTGGSIGAGIVGGGVADLTGQGLNYLGGGQDGYSPRRTICSMAVGGAFGGAVGALRPTVTTGHAGTQLKPATQQLNSCIRDISRRTKPAGPDLTPKPVRTPVESQPLTPFPPGNPSPPPPTWADGPPPIPTGIVYRPTGPKPPPGWFDWFWNMW
ncbi:discoidin domain-containing protein (plasmid) [Isosphaeraceae bacterium EP7]